MLMQATRSYLAFKTDCALSTNDAISTMDLCVRKIRAWALCDKLEIHDDKTEVIACENIHFSSLFSAVDAARNVSSYRYRNATAIGKGSR